MLAGPSSEGVAMFVRVRGRLSVNGNNELGAGTWSLRLLVWWAGGPQVVAEHCRSVPVGEEVRAGPGIEGGAWFVRVSCRMRDIGDMNSELVLGP